jgi:predicted GIY-YIG superfamily endonuclease
MHFVYLIQSLSNRTQYYTGLTDSLPQRLEAHNSSESTHTSKFRPWKYVVTLGFDERAKAIAFERYLKSGSGQAFAKRHFR